MIPPPWEYHPFVDIPTLTVNEAIAQRRQLHKKKVRVRGVYTVGREHSALESLSEPNVLDRQGRHQIWIQFPALRKSEVKHRPEEYHRSPVEIYGTFNADGHGHMSVYAAEINMIEITKLPPSPMEPREVPQ